MLRVLLFTAIILPLTSIQTLSSEITLKEGDTLHTIAIENNISLRELMEENKIYDSNKT